MSHPQTCGEGFEMSRVRGTAVAWLRLWWDNAGATFDGAVIDTLRKVAQDGWEGVVIDLREAPPLANFPVRRRILAAIKTAVNAGLPSLILVGPSSLQRRDMRRLCSDSPGLTIINDPDDVNRWLRERSPAGSSRRSGTP